MRSQILFIGLLAMAAALPLTPAAAAKSADGLVQEKATPIGSKTSAHKLSVGDPAPPLPVSRWIKGQKVDRFEPGKVYVLDFWATWCGPCIESFPHLTRLQKQYADKGVTLIGVSVWEEDQAVVEPFVTSSSSSSSRPGDEPGSSIVPRSSDRAASKRRESSPSPLQRSSAKRLAVSRARGAARPPGRGAQGRRGVAASCRGERRPDAGVARRGDHRPHSA